MRNGRKDQAKGLLHQAKGSAKEVAGKIIGNPQLKAEGAGENVAGKVQEKFRKRSVKSKRLSVLKLNLNPWLLDLK